MRHIKPILAPSDSNPAWSLYGARSVHVRATLSWYDLAAPPRRVEMRARTGPRPATGGALLPTVRFSQR